MVKSIFKIDFFLIKYYTLLSGDDMKKLLLIKYGELSTKKDNINFFIKTLKDNIEVSLKNIDANITYDKGRMFIRTSEDNFDNVIDKLKHVFGIHEIVVAYELDNVELDNIKSTLIEIIKDKKFDQSQFDYEKNYLIRADKMSDENIDSSNNKKLWDIVDKEELTGLTSEHYKEALDKLNNERLYELYLENIFNNKPFIYVYGNIEKESLDKLFDKYYPLSKKKIDVEKNYMTLLPIVDEKNIEIPTKFNQTELVMVYQVEVTENNYFRLSQLNDFLSSKENNLIFKTLRTKHNLVYHAGTHTRARSGILFVDALIQDKNIDAAIKLVNEVFESLKDKKVLAECLSKAQKYVSYDLLVEEDDLFNEIDKKINDDLELNGLSKTAKLYEETTVEDMLDFIQNVKHTSTIIFRGVGNDKNND